MGHNELDNYECEGQLSFDDVFGDVPEKVFAVSKIFARARKQMNLAELKTFVYCLTQIKWTEEMPNLVYLDKKVLADIVGVHSDQDHLSVDLYRSIRQLPDHSLLEFKDADRGFYDRGFFISRVTMLKNRVRIKFDDEYLKLFGNLEKDYITMWSLDIFRMKSERSVIFYEELRLHSDTRKTNRRSYGVKALKELFGIPKDGPRSYVRPNGSFNRPAFEKYVIDPLCEDLKNCHMLQLVVNEDGKFYRKVKSGCRIVGYEFCWDVTDRPSISDASGAKETMEAIKKSPEVLKVANDIVHKKAKRKKNNAFADFDQREYDMDKLEDMLLGERRSVE